MILTVYEARMTCQFKGKLKKAGSRIKIALELEKEEPSKVKWRKIGEEDPMSPMDGDDFTGIQKLEQKRIKPPNEAIFKLFEEMPTLQERKDAWTEKGEKPDCAYLCKIIKVWYPDYILKAGDRDKLWAEYHKRLNDKPAK